MAELDRAELDMRVHATALVVGTTGLLITGPSGAGKTTLALRLIALARSRGLYADLIADDQVELTRYGQAIVASAPQSIAGLVELRGAGPVAIACAARAVIHCAIAPAAMTGSDRVAREDERWHAATSGTGQEAWPGLPLYRIAYDSVGDPLLALRLLRGTV
jgi:serine kinase of HPr protein (carbohydrate metabolism regulator)